ncbi:hypothetical protein QBC35DRAFT_66578 [Podospora australis]|uniref:Uncharacterized protein n=1 Tax=Podospora australis TaxID=1536484 RepID=A0AAN7AFP3_9PEZI|nr:hypothetical protein QBC35DRAFT_66578 [Podospora australis]
MTMPATHTSAVAWERDSSPDQADLRDDIVLTASAQPRTSPNLDIALFLYGPTESEAGESTDAESVHTDLFSTPTNAPTTTYQSTISRRSWYRRLALAGLDDPHSGWDQADSDAVTETTNDRDWGYVTRPPTTIDEDEREVQELGSEVREKGNEVEHAQDPWDDDMVTEPADDLDHDNPDLTGSSSGKSSNTGGSNSRDGQCRHVLAGEPCTCFSPEKLVELHAQLKRFTEAIPEMKLDEVRDSMAPVRVAGIDIDVQALNKAYFEDCRSRNVFA